MQSNWHSLRQVQVDELALGVDLAILQHHQHRQQTPADHEQNH
jgi:hypothetical protein